MASRSNLKKRTANERVTKILPFKPPPRKQPIQEREGRMLVQSFLNGQPIYTIARDHQVSPEQAVEAIEKYAAPTDLKGMMLKGVMSAYEPLSMTGLMRADPDHFVIYNPSELASKRGLGTYTRMMMDDQVKAAITFKRKAVIASGWTVEPPDGKPDDWEPKEFIQDQFARLPGTFNAQLESTLSSLIYGYSIGEMVFYTVKEGKFKGKIGLSRILNRRPHEFAFRVSKEGIMDGIVQRGPGMEKALPLEKFILHSYNKEFDNPYGTSDLDAAYNPWWAKYNSYKWLVMYLERYGIPPTFALYNPHVYPKALVEDLKTVMKTLQSGSAGVLPRTAPEDLELWAPELAAQVANVFIPALQMFNQDISRGILMPGLLGYTPDQSTGSLARSRVHFDVFMLVMLSLQSEIEEIVRDQIIKTMMRLNYGREQELPIFKFKPFSEEIKEQVFGVWGEMLTAGAVKSREADEDHIRTALGFPDTETAGEVVEQPQEAGFAPTVEGGEPAEDETEDGDEDLFEFEDETELDAFEEGLGPDEDGYGYDTYSEDEEAEDFAVKDVRVSKRKARSEHLPEEKEPFPTITPVKDTTNPRLVPRGRFGAGSAMGGEFAPGSPNNVHAQRVIASLEYMDYTGKPKVVEDEYDLPEKGRRVYMRVVGLEAVRAYLYGPYWLDTGEAGRALYVSMSPPGGEGILMAGVLPNHVPLMRMDAIKPMLDQLDAYDTKDAEFYRKNTAMYAFVLGGYAGIDLGTGRLALVRRNGVVWLKPQELLRKEKGPIIPTER